jgi:hypothetical protein
VLVLVSFALLVYHHHKAMSRAYRYNAHIAMLEAFRHYEAYGTITNPSSGAAHVFALTNQYTIHGTNYECVLGMVWQGNSNHMVGITREGITLWLETGKTAEIMEFNRRTPALGTR